MAVDAVEPDFDVSRGAAARAQCRDLDGVLGRGGIRSDGQRALYSLVQVPDSPQHPLLAPLGASLRWLAVRIRARLFTCSDATS